MFKMVQTCSIFVGSFSQCLNLVESGHKAGNIGTTECPSENARPHHITPPPTMQNLGAAISLWQLQNAHIHECFSTVIPWCSQLQVMDTIMSILRWQPKNIQELWVSFCHCGIALIHFDTLQASRQKGNLQKQKRLMLENRLVLQCFTGHLLLLGSPWTQFCSASVEEQWEAGQGRTLTFFELRTLSYAIMCHFLVSEIANCFGHFFLSRNQSPKSCIAAWTEHTHAAICMWLKQNKQMSSSVSWLRQFMSIYYSSGSGYVESVYSIV